MVKLVTDQKEYTQAWENKEMDLLQSWQWGEIKEPEFEPVRLLINDIPVTIFTKKAQLPGLKYGYIPRAFSDSTFQTNDLKELLDYCKGTNLKLIHLSIDPNLTKPQLARAFADLGFKNIGTTIQPNQTDIIDLNKSEEQLWLDMRPSSRRNINKAIKKGCKALTLTNGDDAVKRFFDVNKQVNAEARIKYIAYDFAYYKKVWDILSKENMARIYIISLEDQDIGAYFVTHTKIKLNELYGGVNELGKSVRAGHLIKWHSIQEAKKLGLKEYDQWGVAPLLKKQNEQSTDTASSSELLTADFDPNDKLAYISEFKFSFGGKYVEFLPQQLFVFSKSSYSLFKLLNRFSKILK